MAITRKRGGGTATGPKSPYEIARRYLNACRDAEAAPALIGARKLKRKTVPPFARPNALLKRDIYQRAISHETDRFSLSRLESRIRRRDEDHVVRLTESTVVDWIIREVNWHPARSSRGFTMQECVPLLTKEALSHLRTELNFAYNNRIRWQLVVPFIYMVGGFEVISARLAHDGYPLSGQSWLRPMQEGALQPAGEVGRAQPAKFMAETPVLPPPTTRKSLPDGEDWS